MLEQEKIVSQERYKNLVEMSEDGIATFNTSGYVTFLNNAFCNITGYKREELMGKHITNMQTLRKRDILKYVKGLSTILQGQRIKHMDFTFNKKNGLSGIGYDPQVSVYGRYPVRTQSLTGVESREETY